MAELCRSSWGVIVAHWDVVTAHPVGAPLVIVGLAAAACRASWVVARR